METSIFYTVKEFLGIPIDDCSFDQTILLYLSMALSTLTQLGVGPDEGFTVDGIEQVWQDLIGDNPSDLDMVKGYVCLTVRNFFDPPQNSYLVNSIEKKLEELTWRIREQVAGRRKLLGQLSGPSRGKGAEVGSPSNTGTTRTPPKAKENQRPKTNRESQGQRQAGRKGKTSK